MGLAAGAVQDAAAQSPALTLSETSLAVTEGSTAQYTVQLATQPSADVTVSISGTSGTDLTLNRSSLTFTTTNYGTARTVTVSAAQDDDATSDTATLTHSASGGGYGSVSADLPVTVTDTTRMRVAIVLPGSIQEGGSTPIRAMLPMALDEDVSITVTVTPNGGRADEYTLSANRTLTIAAGQTESTGEVTFTSVDDSIYTGIRYFNVTLTPDHARVDARTESLFAVVDDDDTITGLLVSPSPSTIFENGGQATLRGFKRRLHDGVVTLSVSLDPSDRATLSGSTLTFQPGAFYSTETLTITATDNNVDEADQTITISATVAQGRGVRNPSSVSLTIRDDEAMSTELALLLTPQRAWEGLTSTVTAVASAPLPAAATITVSASPGHSQTRAGDYVLSANRVLTIPAGGTRSTGTVTIATVDDELRTTRRRRVTVSGTVTGGGGLTDPADRTLAIFEDDSGVAVDLVATPATIGEGEVSTITMRAREAVPADVTVTVTTTTSDAGELSANTVLMIAEGETASTGTVTFTATDDTDATNETVTLRGSASSDSQFVFVSSTSVFVIDDDAASPHVVISPVPATVFEGGTSAIIARLTQALSDDVTLTIGVDEMHTNHTASASEYTMSTNRTLTIAAGSTRSTGVVTLTATNDEYYGPDTLRRVVLEVDSVTGISASQVHKHSAWSIREDEYSPRVTLDVAPASISENGGQSSVTARLNTIVDAAIEVVVRAAPVGTADTGDFSQTGTTLSFAARQKASTGTVTITAVNDDVDGPDRILVLDGTVRKVGMGRRPRSLRTPSPRA